MRIIDSTLTRDELTRLAEKTFGDFVKSVVDVELRIVAIDAELHSDLEASLLEKGSKQKDLWGINLYPKLQGDESIEFDSMINMRPSQGNLSRGVDSKELREKIVKIVSEKIL